MGICGSSRPSRPVKQERQMRHRTRSFLRGVAVALALALAATISIAGQTQSHRQASDGEGRARERRSRKSVQGAANAGWPARPAGVLDQLDLRAAPAAQWRDQRDLHARRSRSRDQECRGTRSGADRARHDRRRALRLQPVRVGSQPVHVRAQHADVPDRGSAGRQDSAGQRGRSRSARRSARPRARPRAVSTTPSRTCRSARAASSWAEPDPR